MNWADNLPMHVVKELMGHSSIATTQKFYNQVDDVHRAKAAAAIDFLVASCDVKEQESEMTDARLTPRANLGQHHHKGQS